MWLCRSAMENNCTMVEYTEEDEIELSLGLSIGGSLRKSKPAEKAVACSIDINTDLREYAVTPVHVGEVVVKDVVLNRQTKREIHALRRQEARKKREEKQLMKIKGICRARNGEEYANDDDGVAEGGCKRARVETQDEALKVNGNVELDPPGYASSHPYPGLPMQYPYPGPVQYVPFGNGFAFPYVMPCWAPGAGAGAVDAGNGTNVVHPVACRSFRPFRADRDCGFSFSSGCDYSEQNSGKAGGNGKPVSNVSPGCSSSGISEYRSTSLQDGSSGDSGSDSSHTKSGKPQLNASTGSDTQGNSEHSAFSHLSESAPGIDKERNTSEKAISSGLAQSSVSKPKEEASSETQPDPINKPISIPGHPTLSPLKGTKQETCKPPEPQTQNHDTLSLAQMPCVSTTGNGPNGKTVTGFLYRYTKSEEVSIVCVCHGNFFSPAEFVEHAGGVDVTHPLRHITVVPSAFG
ncbi:hypothetical protein L1049_005084 [Liquidambar formosana]|uniref:Ninja-family protein n=1 Tax=Liquidambar formosana TaxID=63359 RepID=A0AAP0WXF2_LIQFO